VEALIPILNVIKQDGFKPISHSPYSQVQRPYSKNKDLALLLPHYQNHYLRFE
jgi:hypothetical protein